MNVNVCWNSETVRQFKALLNFKILEKRLLGSLKNFEYNYFLELKFLKNFLRLIMFKIFSCYQSKHQSM
jgi:hypothetical protein